MLIGHVNDLDGMTKASISLACSWLLSATNMNNDVVVSIIIIIKCGSGGRRKEVCPFFQKNHQIQNISCPGIDEGD